MDYASLSIFQFVVELTIFLVLCGIGRFAFRLITIVKKGMQKNVLSQKKWQLTINKLTLRLSESNTELA